MEALVGVEKLCARGMGSSAWARAAARQSQPRARPSRRGAFEVLLLVLSALKVAIGSGPFLQYRLRSISTIPDSYEIETVTASSDRKFMGKFQVFGREAPD